MKRLFILLVLPVLLSCNEQVDDLVMEQGYDFFPVKYGQYKIYEVDEVIYKGAQADSNHYFLKEVIQDSIVSGDQTVNYVLKRYRREDTTQNWRADSVWTTRRNNMQAIVTENNIPYVKMVFPVKEGSTWNGNALNTRDALMYQYESVGNYTLLDEELSVNDVIKVIIEDIPANLVGQDERSEIYVRGIGLVEKDYISLLFCQSGCTPGKAEDGRIYRQHLIAYGEE